MRLARTVLIVSAFLLGAPLAHGQVAHSTANCGCESCQSGCSSCGFLPGLTTKLGSCVGVLFGSHVGCDGRHQVYKAALRRNSFDKKFQLPIPYYRHILPIYRHDRCCCGPHAMMPAENCPTCHQGEVMGEQIIETRELSQPVPPQPTPAEAYQSRPIVPGAVVPAKRESTDRTAIVPVVRPEARAVRQASATAPVAK